jgi:hypothetical protein
MSGKLQFVDQLGKRNYLEWAARRRFGCDGSKPILRANLDLQAAATSRDLTKR